MTPARTGSGEGNFIINRRFNNVGTIKRSLGTKHPRVYRQRVALIEKLHKAEKYELLRAFRDGRVTIEAIVEADARGETGFTLSSLALHDNLWSAFERRIPEMAESKNTTARYAKSQRALKLKAKKWLPEDAPVNALATVPWRELKASWGTSGTDWMHLRRAVSRFLTIHLDDVYHPFRREVIKRIPTAKVNKRKVSLAPEQFEEIIGKANPEAAIGFWFLLATGMRGGEYAPERMSELRLTEKCLNARMHTIHNPAQKTDDAEAIHRIDPRIWHIVEAAVPARHGHRYYQDHWRAAADAAGYPHLKLHDLRHVHGQWAIDAKVPESKVQSSFRHKSPGMTREYLLTANTLEVSTAIADTIYRKKA